MSEEKKDEGYFIQSLRFPKPEWNLEKAKKWVAEHPDIGKSFDDKLPEVGYLDDKGNVIKLEWIDCDAEGNPIKQDDNNKVKVEVATESEGLKEMIVQILNSIEHVSVEQKMILEEVKSIGLMKDVIKEILARLSTKDAGDVVPVADSGDKPKDEASGGKGVFSVILDMGSKTSKNLEK